jgi:hypothetical protein
VPVKVRRKSALIIQNLHETGPAGARTALSDPRAVWCCGIGTLGLTGRPGFGSDERKLPILQRGCSFWDGFILNFCVTVSHVSKRRCRLEQAIMAEEEILGTLKKASAAAFQGTGSDPLNSSVRASVPPFFADTLVIRPPQIASSSFTPSIAYSAFSGIHSDSLSESTHAFAPPREVATRRFRRPIETRRPPPILLSGPTGALYAGGHLYP